MSCPYLEYRRSDGEGLEFDHERAYCGIQESFVSPVIADVCNGRDRFHHTTHCEVYLTTEEVDGDRGD
jgi:hypothetical protein